MGRKKQPHYRIVVADSLSPRDGRFVESLGYYKPLSQPARLVLDMDRLDHWLGEGAMPSGTVKSLITKARQGGDGSVAVGEVAAEEREAKRAEELAAKRAAEKRKAEAAAAEAAAAEAAAAAAAAEAAAAAAAEAAAAEAAEAAAAGSAEAEAPEGEGAEPEGEAAAEADDATEEKSE
jgi:small subunit ribosomal protein S16